MFFFITLDFNARNNEKCAKHCIYLVKYLLGADSLDTVELIMEFEKEFGISIPDDQAEKIGTVGDAVSYIEEHAK